MSTVYVVIMTDANGENNLQGVFSTEEKAVDYVKDFAWGDSESKIQEIYHGESETIYEYPDQMEDLILMHICKETINNPSY